MTADDPQFPAHFGPLTPADYLAIVVLPTLAEFMAAPDNRRRMYLACIATAHMVDHIARSINPNGLGKYAVRETIRKQSDHAGACLAVVEGISTGTKHAGPDPKQRQQFNYAPGQERFMPPLGASAPGGGQSEAAWLPGFIVDHAGCPGSVDDCVRGAIRAFATAYPDLFKGIDLTAADQSRDRF